VYYSEEILSYKLGIDKDILNSWKEKNMDIEKEYQQQISKAFSLMDKIWKDTFIDESSFLLLIDKYKTAKIIEDVDMHEEFSNDHYVKTGEGISDTQKFNVIYTKYNDKYINQKTLAKDMAVSTSTVSHWRKKDAKISDNYRIEIGKFFRLNSMIWKDSFKSEEDFEEKLDSYSIDKYINDSDCDCDDLNLEEEKLLDALELQDVIAFQNYIDDKSNIFLYSLSALLEKRGKVHEAIEVLMSVKKGLNDDNCFNKVEHLKAKLYSHNDIKKWDKAISILVKLKRKNYNLSEAEINTLYASNMKRKVLSDSSKSNTWIPKEKVDMSLLSNATLAYYEEYKNKLESPTQYYDAINYAYLHRITEHLEGEAIEEIDLKKMYGGLWSTYSLIHSDWWQVISDAEFLMLIGELELARLKLNDFFENHKLTQSEIEPTFRQLELYIHFTDDNNAKHFYDNLKECWCYYNS
jgi:hypothetical protein